MSVDDTSFERRIRQKIRHKRFLLIKKAMRQGQNQAQKSGASFLEELTVEAKNMKRQKIQLAADLAQHLIEQKMHQEPERITVMLAGLLRNVPEHTDVEVSLNPIDASLIKSSLNTVNILTESPRQLTIVEDPKFLRGSIVIKANKSIVDAHIKTQIDRAKDLLLANKEHKKWRS